MGEERESNISVQLNISHSRFFFPKKNPKTKKSYVCYSSECVWFSVLKRSFNGLLVFLIYLVMPL